jgi:hypothetical protein
LDEAIGPGQADGLVVRPLSVEVATFKTCDLGSDQRRTIGKVLRAILSPLLKLTMVGGYCLQMAVPLRRRDGIAERSPGKRGVEMVLC